MGIGPDHIELYLAWARAGWLKRGNSILDFGAQELFCANKPEAVNELVRFFEREPFREPELSRLANNGMAGEMLQRAGLHYVSIDYKPYPFGILLDLNRDKLPPEHHGKYQLVTNHGTSEHVLNQWNVFEAIHDATAAGGLMFHSVPSCGEFEHGIINYNAKFFWSLQEANSYERLQFAIYPSGALTELPESFAQSIEVPVPIQSMSAWVVVLFRKTRDEPFSGLVDPAFR